MIDLSAKYDLTSDAGFLAMIEGEGLYKIGGGSQREVFSSADFPYVVKRDKAFNGNHPYGFNYGNYVEAITWLEACENGYSDHCAEVLALSISGQYLLMEKADTDTYPAASEYDYLVDTLYMHGIVDLHSANVGYVGDRLVAIDYGLNEAHNYA